MFYRLTTIKRRIKEAWKAANLLVGLTQEGWFYVGGTYWLIVQDIKNTPKEFKAAVIELAGDLPRPGEVFRAGKDGNQMEMENLQEYLLPKIHETIGETGEEYEVTNIVMRWGDSDIRFLRSLEGTNAAIMGDELCSIPDPDAIDKGKGETEIIGPIRPAMSRSLIWHNDDTWYAAWPVTTPDDKDPRREDVMRVAKGFGCDSIMGKEAIG